MTTASIDNNDPHQVSSLDLVFPKYMLFCVTISSLTFFANGWVTGSANLPGKITHDCPNGASHVYNATFPDCLPMSDALWGFSVASFCIGGLVGSLIGGYLQSKFGRKRTIAFNALGFIIGAILISCATYTAMFVVGRILCGYSCGLGSLVVPVYIGEVSTIKARGMMGTLNQLMIVTGILLACIVGFPLSTVPLWRLNYAIVAIPALFQLVAMQLCVESPRYLISIRRTEEARSCLQRLRKDSNIETEFYDMIEAQLGTKAAMALATTNLNENMVNNDQIILSSKNGEDTLRVPMNFLEIFGDKLIRRIAIIVILLHAFSQLIGINAVMYYSTTIFDIAFNSSDMSKYMAIVTSAVNFISTVISVCLIDRLGRRTLLLVSSAGACVSLILLVIGYAYTVGILLVISVFAYVFFFAIGMGPTPWILMSELTPIYAVSSVGSMATCVNWSMNFLVGQCFPIIFSRIQGYSFVLFTVVAFALVGFGYFFIPETKGRSLEDIATEFGRCSV